VAQQHENVAYIFMKNREKLPSSHLVVADNLENETDFKLIWLKLK